MDVNSDPQAATPYILRFGIVLSLVFVANLLPLIPTWRAFEGDGYECVGLPFFVFVRGGNSYTEEFHTHHFVANLLIGIIVSHFAAHAIPSHLWPRQFTLRTCLLVLTMAALIIAIASELLSL